MAFKDIAGQSKAVQLLRNSADCGKLAHAMVFHGPAGVGKKLCALALAQYLNCVSPEGGDGCGSCSGCAGILKLSHPDLRVISPEGKAGEITIESIRRLRREIYMKPLEGACSVFIVDEAEKLNEESSNALLKVLEEPPEQSVLVLLTSELYSLQPTVLSRCQVVKFRRLNSREVTDVLKRNPGLSSEDINFLAGICEGSPGKALEIYRKGVDTRRKILEWFSAAGNRTVEGILNAGEDKIGLSGKDLQERRERLAWFFEILLSWHRDVLFAAAGAGTPLNREFEGEIRSRAETMKIAGAMKAMAILLQAREELALFANPKLVFENTMIKLVKLSEGEAG